MTKISSSTRFNEIAAELATLNGVHKISDIVNLKMPWKITQK